MPSENDSRSSFNASERHCEPSAKCLLIFMQEKPRGGPGWTPMLDALCAHIQARADDSGMQPVAVLATLRVALSDN